MATSVFKLPDLGEGLPDAEIVEWHVSNGDQVGKDQELVAVETAKAIVEVPSPYEGTLVKRYGEPGDVLGVGEPLAAFETEDGEEEEAAPKQGKGLEEPTAEQREDAGSVVGAVESGDEVVKEEATGGGRHAMGAKATPAVRALAKRLEVELSTVSPSGADGMVTAQDVRRVAEILKEVGPMEQLRGVRKHMARTMTQAHAEVAAVTVMDDADIDHWDGKQNVMLRLIRAIVAGREVEPGLNAWYDSHAVGRRVLKKIDLAIAVDSEDGLFVPVLRDVANRDEGSLRSGLEEIKAAIQERNVPPEEMRSYTFTLSNFGTMGGRYASPIVVPPAVALLGAGAIQADVVAVDGQPAVHKILPLSLTFDHRCVTGGEATRFITAVKKDLES
ncbi:MAG: Lipoamide acyltransferase component of branched-chain alpha-keto acid dehydrogenase complex [Gammaproteobacteria bacterium]|nr:Lipoamide acyltransferase component of branched-chain alpha-keto acid dehydrogenase complex [Gammaproteobacteria bacterium]